MASSVWIRGFRPPAARSSPLVPLAVVRLAVAGAVALASVTPGMPTAAGQEAKVRVLQVGPEREYGTPSAAAAVARDGDTVEIDAGTYSGDVAVWRANRLTIRGVGNGRPHLKAAGENAEGKAIWVIKGNNTTVENIEFSGARVPDGNGAGIRQEGKNLTVRGSYFHDNQMGLLAGDNKKSTIVIEYSTFADSDSDTALGHNIYVNGVKRFILRYCSVYGATSGHNVKSRAKRTDILYNRLADNKKGRSSYVLDLPNGGYGTIIGNVIQQGRRSENSTLLAYGEEGINHASNKLFVIHNTFVNDRSSGTFLRVENEPRVVELVNNIFAGPGSVGSTNGWSLAGNVTDEDQTGFVAPRRGAYGLNADSPALDAGVQVSPPRLRPKYQYMDTADREPRQDDGSPDAGAYERD